MLASPHPVTPGLRQIGNSGFCSGRGPPQSRPSPAAIGSPYHPPALFTLYINPLLSLMKAIPGVTPFADDLIAKASSNCIHTAEQTLQPALDELGRWAHNAGLQIAAPKCSTTVFTINPKEANIHANLNIGGTPVPHADTPVFLGVTLDRTLSFRPHAETLASRLQSRLQAMRAISGRTWGQDESSLRMVYNATVQSTIAYGSGTYGSFAKTSTLDIVNRSINQGARIITGLHASTPVGPLKTEACVASIEEISSARAAMQLEQAARVPDHPLEPFINRVPGQHRLQRSSFVDKATTTIRDAGLNDLPREPLPRPRHPSSHHSSQITFHRVSTDKSQDDGIRRNYAESALAALPTADATLWTDGSATTGTELGGAGGILYFAADDTTETFAEPAGRFCSSYRAEMVALIHGLCLAATDRHKFTNLRICTDSLSAVTGLEKGPLCQNSTSGQNVWDLLNQLGCPIQLVHVPAHVGLVGNEAADALAAEGSAKQQSDILIDIRTARATLSRKCREDHQRAARRQKPNSDPNGSANFYWKHTRPVAMPKTIPRRLQTGIRRLRTNHSVATAAYRARIGLTDSDKCDDCGETDTVKHLVTDCPRWFHERMRHIGTGFPTLEVLNDPEKMASFLSETGRIPA